MEEWKFLLQKDGDRSWLPLDCPDAEILEGRYRLVARSSQTNTDIGIRICHLATEEDPPKRRIQKRSSRTNENGLMVVIPFTYLRAGIWEISCFSTDPMSDLMGDTLHHTVCLSVAAPVAETDLDDWAPSDAVEHSEPVSPAEAVIEVAEETVPVSNPESVEVAQSAGLSMNRLLEMTDQLSHQVVEEAFREFHWETEASTDAIARNESDSSTKPLSTPTTSDSGDGLPEQTETSLPALHASTLRLQLERTALTASRGQVFTLAGQVVVDDLAQLETEIPAHWLQPILQEQEDLSTSATEDSSTPAVAPKIVARELHLCLRDPQSSTILIREQQAFPSGTPPLSFSFSVSLPHTLSTYLLLGEVVLYGAPIDQDEATIALQVIPFTVTVDPENLVEELKKVNAALDKAILEDGSRGAELADLAVQFSLKLRQEKLKSPLDLSFLNLTTVAAIAEAEPPAPSLAQPTGTTQVALRSFATANPAQATLKQILPPQLHPYPGQHSEQTISKKHLELPVFDRAPAVAPTPPTNGDSALEDLFTSAVATPIDAASVLQKTGLEESDFEVTIPAQSGQEQLLQVEAALEQPSVDVADLAEAMIASPGNPPESVQSEPTETEPNELGHQPATQAELDRSLQVSTQTETESPIQLEFQSLKLQERFLHRLNQLAGDTALITSLKRSFGRATEESTSTLGKSSVATISSATFLESGAMAKEIVVEDDLSWRDEVPRSPRHRLNLDGGKAASPLLVLPEDAPVPTPVVEILTDEIIAESPIHLRVKLPDIAPKIAVKLWVSDRQTRTLLDGPRWLMDFSPNGFDQLETNLQITAPQGSLDIRIEAISVELQTQRESQKIGFDRSVAPAELPSLWDDDLDF